MMAKVIKMTNLRNKIIGLFVAVVLTYTLVYYTQDISAEPHTRLIRTYMLPEVVNVVDGDTINVILGPLKHYPPLDRVKIRINGIDTPESTWRAKCEKEKKLGLQAKKALEELISDRKRIKIKNYKYGKYGGRIIADVIVGSVNAAERLIARELAKPYTGQGPKPNWCE